MIITPPGYALDFHNLTGETHVTVPIVAWDETGTPFVFNELTGRLVSGLSYLADLDPGYQLVGADYEPPA